MSEAIASADAALFSSAVSCDLQARMTLAPTPLPAGALEAAERLLRDLAMVEERRGEPDDQAHPPDPVLRRIEAKLDLTLQLLAQALPSAAGPAFRSVRLSALGVRFETSPGVAAAAGAVAVLVWQPGEGVPLALHLPVTCVAQSSGQSWWRFAPLPPSIVDLLERHVFRLHRRGLAASRRT